MPQIFIFSAPWDATTSNQRGLASSLGRYAKIRCTKSNFWENSIWCFHTISAPGPQDKMLGCTVRCTYVVPTTTCIWNSQIFVFSWQIGSGSFLGSLITDLALVVLMLRTKINDFGFDSVTFSVCSKKLQCHVYSCSFLTVCGYVQCRAKTEKIPKRFCFTFFQDLNILSLIIMCFSSVGPC